MSCDNNYIDPRFIPDYVPGVETIPYKYSPTWKEFKQDRITKAASETKYDFVHRLSYNKAIGYINRRDRLHIYNGSSFNRKPSNKPATEWEIAYALASEEEQLQMEIERDYTSYRSNHGVNFYQYTYKGDKLKGIEIVNQRPPRDPLHSLSKRSKDKVKDKMLAMYRACSGKNGFRSHVVDFTFCTLTFIAPVQDNKGMDILNVWFATIKKRYGKFNYIWVAERQDNGNIHFHMIADKRFPIGYINSLWVKNQMEHGVINVTAVKKLRQDHNTTFSKLHKDLKYNLVSQYLNPVDIKTVKTIDGISCYLTNYVTKNEGKFECAAWKSNNLVSKLFTNKIIDKKLFDKTGVAKLNQITSRPRNVVIEGKTVYKPPRTYTNETYYGQWCTINTIYNKGRFRHSLNDLEEINKMILNIGNSLDSEEVRQLISIDREDYQWQFGAGMKKIFEIKAKEIKAIAEIQEPSAEKIRYDADPYSVSDNLGAWRPVAAWDLN
jgi:hypothetical protein